MTLTETVALLEALPDMPKISLTQNLEPLKMCAVIIKALQEKLTK
jgi:hypothetical protein